MFATYEIRTLNTLITMENGTALTLVTEVVARPDGLCDLRFSHTGQGSLHSQPWFSDSLTWAESLEDALANIEAMARHIQASEVPVVWNDDLVR